MANLSTKQTLKHPNLCIEYKQPRYLLPLQNMSRRLLITENSSTCEQQMGINQNFKQMTNVLFITLLTNILMSKTTYPV